MNENSLTLYFSLWDFALLYVIYTAATLTESYITPSYLVLPDPRLYALARFALWSVYGFAAGLVATGLWVIAHECGHQAFSEYKIVNNTVGWLLHSAYVLVLFMALSPLIRFPI